MDSGNQWDAVEEMVDALSGLLSQGQSRMKVMDEFSRTAKGELFILRFLLEKKTPVLPSEIAEALGSSGARISAALGTLEKKGLINREIDRANRRNILVSITGEGRERISGMMSQMRGRLRTVITEMGLEDVREYLRLSRRFFEIAGRNPPYPGHCEHSMSDETEPPEIRE